MLTHENLKNFADLNIRPSAHVLVLLLHEAQLSVAVGVRNLLHDVEGEGADLLNGVDCNLVFKAGVLPLLKQVVVHLASAEEDLLNGRWVLAGGTIVQDHPLEFCAREQVGKSRLTLRQPE